MGVVWAWVWVRSVGVGCVAVSFSGRAGARADARASGGAAGWVVMLLLLSRFCCSLVWTRLRYVSICSGLARLGLSSLGSIVRWTILLGETISGRGGFSLSGMLWADCIWRSERGSLLTPSFAVLPGHMPTHRAKSPTSRLHAPVCSRVPDQPALFCPDDRELSQPRSSTEGLQAKTVPAWITCIVWGDLPGGFVN